VFAFLALLVKFKIFREVDIGFMHVGHTHCDVDATFSLFSRKLHEEDAFTMDELFRVVTDSQQAEQDRPKVICSHMREMAAWRGVVKPFLRKEMGGHTVPHLFRFFMAGDTPAMIYKDFCDDSQWLPEDGPSFLFAREGNEPPNGPPLNLVQPKACVPSCTGDLLRGWEGVDAYVRMVENPTSLGRTGLIVALRRKSDCRRQLGIGDRRSRISLLSVRVK
jgi:hypothetical protein